MIPLYTENEFAQGNSRTRLKLKCEHCSKEFLKEKRLINSVLNNTYPNMCKYCTHDCFNKHHTQSNTCQCVCTYCSKSFIRPNSMATDKRKKTTNHFCSSSCAATYNNTHKTQGIRISKLELWLQEQLSKLYPNLDILYNDKQTINSELDIYIPSLKLAFELNGIFHYEPIFGQEKLTQIQNNDNRKFQACLENGISLCIIDTSHQKKFTEKSSEKFLKIITNIIKV